MFFEINVCSFTKPVFILNNLSSKSAFSPDFCKLSYVVPIFKSGDKQDVVIAKVFDELVKEELLVSIRSIIVDEQYGFTAGHLPLLIC